MPRPAYTPLDVEQQEATHCPNPNVLRREEPSRSRDGADACEITPASDPLVAFYCSCLVNLPQIIVYVVFAYFNENKVCSVIQGRRAWGIVHAAIDGRNVGECRPRASQPPQDRLKTKADVD